MERELHKFCADLENQLAAGTVQTHKEAAEQARREAAVAAQVRTFRQYVEQVFLPEKELSAAPNSLLQYRRFLDNVIFPALGDCLMSEITSAQCSALLLGYQKTHAYSSSCSLHSLLSSIFDSAELDGTVPLSPMLRVRRPRRSKAETVDAAAEKAYTAEEVARIIAATEQEPLQWRVFIRVMLDTGARNGEVAGLQWRDINFGAATVTFQRSLQYTAGKGVYVSATKTGRSRTVDVGLDTLDLLRQLRREQAVVSPFVFRHHGSSEPIHPNSSTGYFKYFSEKYDIPDFHPHKLRHTSATLAIAAGADVKSVSERLGHSDIGTTLRTYTHANEETIRAAGQAVRDAIKKAQGQN
ncbi:MAG: site-specific integrase [Clostridiales bacterium]|nr:site-specific integrase [Clostridiales bacterium]